MPVLTPVSDSAVTLTPVDPSGSVPSTYGTAVYGVSSYGSSQGSGLVLSPAGSGSFTLTPED